jgi:hypothetical protein
MAKDDEHDQQHSGTHLQGEKYNVNLQSDPAAPQSDKPIRLSVIATEKMTGNRISQFEVIHDKLMHLVIVSDDLSYFAHVHPKLNDEERIFTITHTFPVAGRYKMWVDAKPRGVERFVKEFRLNVGGKPVREPIPIVADKDFTKNVAAGGQKYQVRLKAPESIKVGQDIDILFEISDSGGKPITDLEPLMAAGGHCVIVSADAEEFLHVHPLKEVAAEWRGGPEVVFRANFPSPGLYKAWGQFQHRENIITVNFVLEAK